MYIDSHMHVDKKNAPKIFEEAKENNVGLFIISGCDKHSIEEAIDLINSNDCVYATVGFHPNECSKVRDKDLIWLENIICNNKKIIGIGEIGLDYYYGKENKDKQIQLFDYQLQLAEKLNLPVVIHTRDAFQDTYNLLKKYKLKGVIHCFGGSLEVAKLYIGLGYYLGIGGILTFKNSTLPNILENIDMGYILLETDSPYLSPEPYRGKENSPKNIPIIAKKISLIKKVPESDVEKITYNNVISLFDLK